MSEISLTTPIKEIIDTDGRTEEDLSDIFFDNDYYLNSVFEDITFSTVSPTAFDFAVPLEDSISFSEIEKDLEINERLALLYLIVSTLCNFDIALIWIQATLRNSNLNHNKQNKNFIRYTLMIRFAEICVFLGSFVGFMVFRLDFSRDYEPSLAVFTVFLCLSDGISGPDPGHAGWRGSFS